MGAMKKREGHMNLLAPRDAGRMLGVSTSRVQQLARSGQLPELRDSSNRRLFRFEDVEGLAKRRKRTRPTRSND